MPRDPAPPPPVRELDWPPERARELGARILDLYAGLLADLPEGPVSPRVTTKGVRAAVALEVPEDPLGDDELVGHLRAMLDHSLRPGSGGFLAYITGAGTVPGALADVLASGLNANLGAWMLSPAATEIELQLVRWLAASFGLPPGAGGTAVSGGALANLTAIKVARDRAAPAVRTGGLGEAPPLRIYASAEAHFTAKRAADVLGLGESAVRVAATDELLAMRVDDLARLIEEDLAVGARPIAIVATAGTTGTGAIDPLDAIADVAARFGVWLHVDAAYGGAAVLSDDLRDLLRGIERADSITFDAHKWLYAPVVSAFLLLRDPELLQRSFSAEASYIVQEREVADRGADLGFEGLQLSRSFSALRVWVALLAHGRRAFVRRIEHDVALTRWLADRVEEAPDLELACPPSLSICCFRYLPEGVDDDAYVDALTMRIVTELQLDGRVFPSNALVHGRAAIRSCIVGYRTEAEHLQRLVDRAREVGARVHGSGAVRRPR